MRTPATATAVVAVAALLLAAGCSSRTAPAALEGRRLTDGPALFLSASPDGSRVAWLAGCAPAPGAAKGQLACTLLAAPLPGGGVQRVADGVAAMEGAFAWGPDGSLAALGRRDPVAASGDLTLLRPGGEPRVVAPRVTAFAWGPASRIAFSAGGGLFVASSDGLAEPVRGGASVTGLAFAPAPGRALAALLRDASGALGLAVWADTGGEPAVVARDVASFAFSPDGGALAAIAGVAPGSTGNLVVVPLAADGKPAAPVLVAPDVGEFRWASGATRLAWLAGFDPRIRAGALASAVPGGAPMFFAPRVTAFELSPSGQQVAFLRHMTDSKYAVHLDLSPSQAAAPGTLAQDAASFEFSPDGRWLYYRAGCAPAGDACVLFRAPATGLGPSASPERLADGVAGVAIDRWRPDRVLVSLVRRDGAGVDLALWSGGRLTSLDRNVLAGSPRFLPPDGRRAVYAVALPARAGLYLADVP